MSSRKECRQISFWYYFSQQFRCYRLSLCLQTYERLSPKPVPIMLPGTSVLRSCSPVVRFHHGRQRNCLAEMMNSVLLRRASRSLKFAVKSWVSTVSPTRDKSSTTTRFASTYVLAAPFPFDSPQQLWIDHAIVHETSESYQESMVQHLEWTSGSLR